MKKEAEEEQISIENNLLLVSSTCKEETDEKEIDFERNHFFSCLSEESHLARYVILINSIFSVCPKIFLSRKYFLKLNSCSCAIMQIKFNQFNFKLFVQIF